MNILVVTSLFPDHEGDHNGRFVLDSILSLIEEKHRVSVLVMKPVRLRSIFFFKSQANSLASLLPGFPIAVCRFLSVPRNRLRWISNFFLKKATISACCKMAAVSKPQLIHVHGELLAVAALKAAQLLELPVVVTVHGAETNRRYWKASGHLIYKTLSAVDRLVIVGEPLRAFFKKWTSHADHFRCVPNGFRVSRAVLEFQKAPWREVLQFISVSNLNDEAKSIDIVLSALAEAKKQGFTNWRYTIVGEGCLRPTLEALAASLDIAKQVVFVGNCSHPEVYERLMMADIFCLPSCPEAFGIAHLEAMAFGLLTIGAKGQGPETFITHNQTGLLVPPKEVTALAALLVKLSKDRPAMEAVAKRGREFACAHFTWANHAKLLTAVYKELVDEK